MGREITGNSTVEHIARSIQKRSDLSEIEADVLIERLLKKGTQEEIEAARKRLYSEEETFRKALTELINKFNFDGTHNMHNAFLADFMIDCVDALSKARQRCVKMNNAPLKDTL